MTDKVLECSNCHMTFEWFYEGVAHTCQSDQERRIAEGLLKPKLITSGSSRAVICIDKTLDPQEAIKSCAELVGDWDYLTEWEHDPAYGVYPAHCAKYPETHIHFLAKIRAIEEEA